MIGHKQMLGKKMMGHKLPLGVTLGNKMAGALMPVEVVNKDVERKSTGGLEKSRRNAGYNSLGGYAGG